MFYDLSKIIPQDQCEQNNSETDYHVNAGRLPGRRRNTLSH